MGDHEDIFIKIVTVVGVMEWRGGAIEESVVQHAIIIFLLVCQFAIFAGIFWAEVLGQA